MNQENDVKKFFNKAAQEEKGYYDSPKSLAFKAQKWARRKLLLMIGSKPQTILDAGSGRGDLTTKLAQKFSESKIIGIDFAEDMITIAKKETKGQPNVSFLKADLTQLPFSDNQFDLCVCLNTLHLLPQNALLKALTELARVTNHLLLVEIKNKNNLYTFFKKIKERLHTKGALTTFTASKEIVNILSKNNFSLVKKNNIFLFGFLSPITVMGFKKN
ncbi:class I SAM-dependent methyltransferase [Patescibacteria group bacterium]|nr:class I SAM-dependent methyltransferase [Patescibacteria group bacterium]MBU4511806.1 class I SAM-dependent methyltransferase [Patescibacteria group bacterium]MCG2692556.1 class I SAM-dependent methyltransferase [Candidatus Parcubacteria bacterium]